MLGQKLSNLALSQRFWTLLVGLGALLGREFLGFDVPDETALAGGLGVIAAFIVSLAVREPNVLA